MKTFWMTILTLWVIILLWPVILAYTLGIVLIVFGINILSAGAIFSPKPDSSIRFGEYEIFKKKK